MWSATPCGWHRADLALSWPAWRVVAYDVVTQGPGELAGLVNSSSGLVPAGILAQRLQNADDGLIALTTFGTGRLTGGVVGNSDRGDSFHGVAIGDETGLGWGRIFFLVGSLAPYAVLRVGQGCCSP
jgi:type IV secretion system protein VirB6